MTVSSIVPVNNYTGNGSSTTFDFDFLIENESELVVTHKNINAGNETVLNLGIDYSINETGNKNGSYITFPLQTSSYSILSTEEMITLSLSLPIKQESEFENSANLNLSVLEWTFDYIVRILQILTRKVERSVKVQEGETTTPDELVNNLYTARSEAQSAAQNAVTEAQKAANSALEAKNASLVLNTKANIDMDNITTAGINNIKEIIEVSSAMPIGTIYPLVCSANYVPEGSLPCDGAEYTKAQFNDLWEIYLSKNVFDISKFTIVGTPTITGDGILQNYGNSTNYITIDTSSFNSDLETKILKLKYRAKLWSNTDQKTIEIGNDFGTTGLNIGNGNANGSLYIQIVNETSQAMSISGTDLNNHLGELYNAEFISNGTNYSFKITFDDGAVFEVSSAVTTPLVLPSVLNVGKINNYLAGQIEIREFLITVDGVEVFNPTASLLNTCTYSEYASDITTYGQCGKFAVKPLAFDSSKITTVGTPTIADDGVVSDFSTSNYVKTSINIDGSITKIREKFHISTFENTTISELYRSNCFVLMIGTGNNYNLRARVGNAVENNWLMVNYTMLPNKDYIGECIINKTTKLATLNLYDENNNLLSSYTNTTPFVSITLTDEDNTVTIGYGNNRAFTNGSIDLKYFSITVDGKEVYNCVSGNTFKVPTIKNGAFIQQALSDSELGKSYNAGLPNITGSASGSRMANISEMTGAFSVTGRSTVKNFANGDDGTKLNGFDFNASRSSSIYGNSETVQPNAVAMRYFVVVATGSVNECQMNWSEWASGLQGKADKTAIDGQWVSAPYLLSSATATGTYTIDLSSYLPSDNCTYEVILNLKTYHTTSCNVTVYANDFPPFEFSSKTYTSDISQYARSQANTFLIPVSAKQVLMKIGTNNASENYLSMIAYRRVGTNV